MGGEAPGRAHLTIPEDPEEASRLARKRLAQVQLIMGVPALFVSVFGLLLAYRIGERPLGDTVFWFVLIAIVGVFLVYFVRALLALRRETSRAPRAPPRSEDESA